MGILEMDFERILGVTFFISSFHSIMLCILKYFLYSLAKHHNLDPGHVLASISIMPLEIFAIIVTLPNPTKQTMTAEALTAAVLTATAVVLIVTAVVLVATAVVLTATAVILTATAVILTAILEVMTGESIESPTEIVALLTMMTAGEVLVDMTASLGLMGMTAGMIAGMTATTGL